VSALLYGSYSRSNQRTFDAALAAGAAPEAASDATENKLLLAIVGLVPVEVIAAHGLILGFTTKLQKDGTVIITDAGLLQASLVALVLGALFLFVAGRGVSPRWSWRDYVRALIPPLAVLAWLSLIGTSALTPWAASYGWSGPTLGVGGVVLGLILLGLSKLAVDPKR